MNRHSLPHRRYQRSLFTDPSMRLRSFSQCGELNLADVLMRRGTPIPHLVFALLAMLLAPAVTRAQDKPAKVLHRTLTGIDVLQQDQFKALHGQRVGLITNHTGRNRDGVTTLQLLHDAKEVNLAALFSPEHGFEGKLDVSKIDDARDEKTGLKIFSLYGETRRPTAEMLASIDTLVFDIQDIGSRFYTYVSTMGEAMHAAEQHGKRFVVLDRPNPINGVDVAGPMLDPGKESFVGFHHLPVRHGMTIGELARMFQAERYPKLNLDVIQCQNWNRNVFYDRTSLTWINPSPNMRCLNQALLYPGIGMLETTNLSVGRGTDTPFEIIGAPWLQAQLLAASLNSAEIPGVTFVPVEFTPDSSKFANELCHGINIIITSREEFEPVRTGLHIAAALKEIHGKEWETKGYLRLMGNDRLQQALVEGNSAADLLEVSREGLEDFLARRQKYLIYQ